MFGSRAIPALLVGLLVSCAGRSERQPLIVLLSEGAALSGTTSPGIATRLSFNGRSAWFVFDTGAGAHTFAQWYVEAAGMEFDSASGGVSARDATGTPVDLRIVRDQTGILENGAGLSIPVGVVSSFPPEFEEAEIGGLLNPQLLAADDEAVVLDLRVPELRIEPFEAAIRHLGARVVPEEAVRACRSTAVAIPNLLFALLVRGDGEEGWLQIDTGADVTLLNSDSRLVQGLVLEQGGETMGIAGRRQEYQRAPDFALSLGEHQFVVDAHVVSSTGRGCGLDGLLGLDVLGRCALVMGQESVAVTCGR